MSLSEETKSNLTEEFSLPHDIFEEMYIDELCSQKRNNGQIDKTIVLRHNSAKIEFEGHNGQDHESWE